jgi:hypothetical protein
MLWRHLLPVLAFRRLAGIVDDSSPQTTEADGQIPRIIGSVDGASRGQIHGWVIDRTAPGRRLAVEMRWPSGGHLVLLADRYRADVHQVGNLGDGYCGFSAPIRRLPPGGPIQIACIEPHVVLGALDRSRLASAVDSAPIVFERNDYILTVDHAAGEQISGWAANTTLPTSRRLLRLRSAGRTLAQQRATLFREDAAKVMPDGYHGFRFAVAASTRALALEDIEDGSVFQLPLSDAHCPD